MPGIDAHVPGNAGHEEDTAELVWLPIAEAATRLKCDAGTIRRRFNNPNYPFRYERREVYDGVEYGIPKAELDMVAGTGDAGHSQATPGTDGQETQGDAGHAPTRRSIVSDWRDDLLAQVEFLTAVNASLQADKDHLRDLLAKQEAFRQEELNRLSVRIEELFFDNSSKDAKIEALESQLSSLESELRATLREAEQRSTQLAHRIADLVHEVERNRTRVYELAPLVEEIPRLQAAVDAKDSKLLDAERELSEIRRIESGRITGHIFRLLRRRSKR